MMMVKTYSGLVHLNGSLLAAVDLETTGDRAGYHEIVQIAVVPLNSDIRPLQGVPTFYTTVRPEHPDRADRKAMSVNGLSINELVLHAPESGRVQDLLREWFSRLDLPFEKNLVPLAHNWSFESSFLKAWLGVAESDRIFHYHPRDSMQYAIGMNDRAAFKGEQVPFNRVSLASLCGVLGVHNDNPHDALCDCLAEAEVYRSMLHLDLI